jgi:hypothetical protein
VTLDLAHIITRAFEISWRHKWLWLLGVFGGGGGAFAGVRGFPAGRSGQGGGNGAATASQLQAFLAQNLWIIALVAVAVALVVVLTFLVSCVAVPASIWAAINLDAGREVRLGQAWREGLRRFGPIFRLGLLRLLIMLALASPAIVAGLLLLGSLSGGFTPEAGGLVLLVVLGLLLFVAGALLVAVALAWSERLVVLSGAGALAAVRQSWWLVRRAFLDTILFAVLMGLLAGVLGIGVGLAAAMVSVPGIVAAVVGWASQGPLLVAGIGWIVILGLAVLLIGGGFVGSVVQVAYALACRDLCRRHGIPLLEPLPAIDPPPAAAQPLPAT